MWAHVHSVSVLTGTIISRNLRFLFPLTNRQPPPPKAFWSLWFLRHQHITITITIVTTQLLTLERSAASALRPLSGLRLTWKGSDYLHFTDHRTSEPEGPSRLLDANPSLSTQDTQAWGWGRQSALHTAALLNGVQLTAQWESCVLKGT